MGFKGSTKLLNRYPADEVWTAGLWLLPAFAVILLFQIVPMFYAFWLSLFQWDLVTPRHFIGLRNYAVLLTETDFWKSIGVTFYYVLVSVPFGLSLALAFALLLQKGLKFLGLYRTAFFLPYITSITAVSIVWLWIYNPNSYGLLNWFLGIFGIQPQKWLQSPVLAMPAVILFLVWKNLGFNIVIFLTRLQNINKNYYEAAMIDGASSWRIFRSITFPLLAPTTAFLFTVSVIYAFQIFPSIFVLTPTGGPKNATTTAVFYLYKNAYEQFNMGYASAIAYALFVVILIVTLLQRRLTKAAREVAT
jgi:multiple sugar transport system permease protein